MFGLTHKPIVSTLALRSDFAKFKLAMSFNGVSRLSFVFPLRGLAKKKKLTAQRIVGMNGRRIVGGTNNFVPLTPYYYYMTASAHFPKNCTPNAAATSCILPARRSSYCFSSSSCNRKRVQPCHVRYIYIYIYMHTNALTGKILDRRAVLGLENMLLL